MKDNTELGQAQDEYRNGVLINGQHQEDAHRSATLECCLTGS